VANPAHLEKLCEGPKAWNAWRQANPNIVPDLSEIQLTLHQRQLGPSNGGPINFQGADLERAVLRYATLTGADLEGGRLVGADLTHARLDKANLAGADLTDANLDQADLTGALLDQAVLFGADLSDTRNLTLAQVEQAFGDASTKLPSNLLPPDTWFPNEHENDDDYAGWGMTSYEEPIELSLYEELGLTEKAGSEEIRASYRNLVKKLHPDINPNNQEAQERFKRVTTAYRILNDAEQRARYDRGEIDGEGRVNPEFEARRQFRRTAYRYYGAAAASFLFAVCVLVGVWYTVLSLQPPQDGALPQVAIVTPKRSERLGESNVSAKTSRADKNVAMLEDAGPDGPEAGTEIQAPQLEPATDSQSQQQAAAAGRQGDAHGAVAPDSLADDAQDANPAILPNFSTVIPGPPQPAGEAQEAALAATAETAQPQSSSSPMPEGAPQMPAGASPAQSPGQAPPLPSQPPANAQQALAPFQSEPRKGGEAQRPLRQGHSSPAGQNKPSAPESWSVGALPSQARQNATESSARLRPVSSSSDQLAEGFPLPLWTQRPASRDIVSQVLRARAIRQTIGGAKRPFTSAEGLGPPPQRRPSGLGAEFPTNALAGKQREAPTQREIPTKPTSAILQRKRPEGGPATPPSTASRAPVIPQQGSKRPNRQNQAVSDILAGGL
jgi:curved DNA-binding protein CbpA